MDINGPFSIAMLGYQRLWVPCLCRAKPQGTRFGCSSCCNGYTAPPSSVLTCSRVAQNLRHRSNDLQLVLRSPENGKKTHGKKKPTNRAEKTILH